MKAKSELSEQISDKISLKEYYLRRLSSLNEQKKLIISKFDKEYKFLLKNSILTSMDIYALRKSIKESSKMIKYQREFNEINSNRLESLRIISELKKEIRLLNNKNSKLIS